MKTILILGGFGFLGTNVLKYIDSNYSKFFKVIVFDKFQMHPHGISFKCLERVYAGDFSDETFIEHIFINNKIDLVFHFLSSTVPSTSRNAQYDVESNLVPTLKLLGIMDKYGVKDIVYLSSGGAIYGDVLQKVHNEEDAVYPKSSYGIVKLAIEKYLLSYSELYGFSTLILRLSNPFGPYHYSEKQGIINIAVRKALKNEPLEIWGVGDGIKDYIFVEDVCRILFNLIIDGIQSNVVNVAASNALSVNDVVRHIQNEIPSFKATHTKSSNVDVQSFELDITKLRKLIEDITFTPFNEALKKTIEWQKNYL